MLNSKAPIAIFTVLLAFLATIGFPSLSQISVLAEPLKADVLRQKQWIQCQAKSGAVNQFGISPGKINALVVTPRSRVDPIVEAFATFYPGRVTVHYVDHAGAPLRIDYEINRKTMDYKVVSTLINSNKIIYASAGSCTVIEDPFKGNLF
jgi:hypothetical protein